MESLLKKQATLSDSKKNSECSEKNQFVDKKGICVVKYVVICTRPHIALSTCPENCT